MTAGAHGPVVAVVGGGFTGAAFAYYLASIPSFSGGRVVVFEPREHLGAGLAYDTDEKVYRINVPAARMTLVAEDEEHFLRWLHETGSLEGDPDAVTPQGHVFPRRGLFGRYVAAHVEALARDGGIRHERSRIRSIRPLPDAGWLVEDDNGKVLLADIVVLATSHPQPQAPGGMEKILSGHPRYVGDATVPEALSAIRSGDRVLVVGAGLTAADVIAKLHADGHEGEILAVSRRGLRSRGHNLEAQEPFGDFAASPSRTALALLRQVRGAVAEAASQGLSWHAVFDRLRGQGGEIWRALPVAERRRLVRHLRPYWDVHRFRIAPQVEAVIEKLIVAGRLSFRAACVADVAKSGNDDVLVRLRSRRGGHIDEQRFDAVIVTTGPGHSSILGSQPFLAELSRAGLIAADPVGLGIHVDADSRALGRDGLPTSAIYVAGPLARGTFGELMGLPQVAEHAGLVASRVMADLARMQDGEVGVTQKAG